LPGVLLFSDERDACLDHNSLNCVMVVKLVAGDYRAFRQVKAIRLQSAALAVTIWGQEKLDL
jgi:hypothetical protein